MNEPESRGPRIRVLIVAGSDLFRSGLASLLAKEPDIKVVAEPPSGRVGVQLASDLRPDVVLVSLRLPDIKGSDATRAILQRSPTTRVLAITVPSDTDEPSAGDDIESVIQAGAFGVLARDTPIDEIVTAVRDAAAASRRLVPRAVEEVLAALRRSDAAGQPHPGHDRLSPRELEVMGLIARGLDNEEIAELTGSSPQSVRQLVSGIIGKLGQ